MVSRQPAFTAFGIHHFAVPPAIDAGELIDLSSVVVQRMAAEIDIQIFLLLFELDHSRPFIHLWKLRLG